MAVLSAYAGPMRFCASAQCVKCIMKPGMDGTMDTKGKGLAGVKDILKEA